LLITSRQLLTDFQNSVTIRLNKVVHEYPATPYTCLYMSWHAAVSLLLLARDLLADQLAGFSGTLS